MSLNTINAISQSITNAVFKSVKFTFIHSKKILGQGMLKTFQWSKTFFNKLPELYRSANNYINLGISYKILNNTPIKPFLNLHKNF